MAVKQRATFPLGVSAEWFKRMNNPKYWTLYDNFAKKPGIHAELTNTTEATNEVCNTNWGLTGAGPAASSDITFSLNGGITIQTQATAEDECIIEPHTLAGSNPMELANWWKASDEPYMQINLVTGAAITNGWIWAGFGTATGATQTTADAMFQAQDDAFWLAYATENLTSTANWNTVSSRVSTETETDTSVVVAVSTLYRLELWLDKDRIPQYYINGNQVATADATAITNVIDMFPMFGIHSISTGENAMTVRNVTVSRLFS